jgi:hypothetical protein
MIEALMFFGIGFLFATLGTLIFIPLIHRRAVRLTARRMENMLPKSMAEVQADKDLLRADFAVAIRRLEMTVNELKERNAAQRAEIGKKDDVINRFRIEREAQNVEILMLKAEAGALRAQCTPLSNTKTPAETNDVAVASAAVDARPQFVDASMTARLVHGADQDNRLSLPRIYSISSPIIDLSPVDSREANLAADERTTVPVTLSPENHRGVNIPFDPFFPPDHETANESLMRRTSSIHVTPDDHFIQGKLPGGFGLKIISLLAAAALTGVGVYAWESSGGDAKRTIAALSKNLSVPAKPAVAIPPEEKKASTELAQQVDALTHEVADMRNNVENLTSKQQPEAVVPPAPQQRTPAAREPETKQARLAPFPQNEPRPAATPETPPTTIPGWVVNNVAGGTATVQGPRGTWRVARGDNLPDLGRVVSIVHWGDRWIVATRAGLISTR